MTYTPLTPIPTSDFAPFGHPSFDPNEYANAILAGEPYPAATSANITKKTVPKEDISVALAKLNYGIDDVTKQLRTVIVTHHEDLLERVAGVSELGGSLQAVRQGLDGVNTSLDKLRLKVRVPYQNLNNRLTRLQRLQLALDALRRTSRFVILARRLESQMSELDRLPSMSASSAPTINTRPPLLATSSGLDNEGDRERLVAQAALNIAELTALSPSTDPPNLTEDPSATTTDGAALHPIDLRYINAVTRHVSAIAAARTRITSEMETMVLSGLDTLNQSILASALQTAFNLRVLPNLVQSLLLDLTEAVEERVKSAFDMAMLAKEANAAVEKNKPPMTPASALTNYRSRVRTEPTNVTAQQWANVLWARLEGLVDDMTGCCIKVYALEKVLKIKKDTTTQVTFLDEVMQALENRPSSTFWTSLARALEEHSKDAATGSSFLQQTLTNGYPRFLRLFHDFFAKIAVYSDTVYTEAHQSPETVLILRAVSRFETLYLSRSTNRLNEAVGSALSGGARIPPGQAEGLAIGRAVLNELDSARFDPLLVRSVAKVVGSCLDGFLGRMGALISRERMALLLTGPYATPQQILNGQLVSALVACHSRLVTIEGEYHERVISTLAPVLKNMKIAYERVTDPLLQAIRRDLSSIIGRIHRVDFGKGAGGDMMSMGTGGSSGYMKELVDKLEFVKSGVLAKFSVGPLGREWTLGLVKHVVRAFVIHASIAKPLSESGKLQLTSDMTELEFALSAFLIEIPSSSAGGAGKSTAGNRGSSLAVKLDTIGDDYRALRGMRPLLFLETPLLASPASTAGLPPLIVIHHIIVRSPHLSLPHALNDWSQLEYVRWVEEHTERESLALVHGCVPKWEAELRKKSNEVGDDDDDVDYVLLVRTVLENAGFRK